MRLEVVLDLAAARQAHHRDGLPHDPLLRADPRAVEAVVLHAAVGRRAREGAPVRVVVHVRARHRLELLAELRLDLRLEEAARVGLVRAPVAEASC